MKLVNMNTIKIIDCDAFFNVFKYLESIMNNIEAYHLLSRVLTYELIQAWEIPVNEF